MDREDVIEGARKSRQMRARFLSDASDTAKYLSPKNVTKRWKDKQKIKLTGLSDDISIFTRNNRVLIAALGAAGLLLAGFRPISKAAKQFRAKQDSQK
jgi:hypothetical protein